MYLNLVAELTRLFYSAGAALVALYVSFHVFSEQVATPGTTHQTYDLIIIGGGTAGTQIALSLAKKLNGSSDHFRILLIEAGPGATFATDVPIMGPLLHGTAIDWRHKTVSQEPHACASLKQSSSRWPSGRIMGGSHALNNMIHWRGYPNDFRGWFSAAETYNYTQDILPFFERADEYLSVDTAYYRTRFADIFVAAGHELFGNNAEFQFPALTQTRNGRRSTRAPLLHRWPYELRTNTICHRILIEQKRAVGVECGGQTIRATRGVIVAAGTVGSPKILMHSGVGVRQHLEAVGIEVVVDLPVGMHLRDHVTTGMDLILVNTTAHLEPWSILSPRSLYEYLRFGMGPLTIGGCEGIGFTPATTAGAPVLQFMLLATGVTSDGGAHLRHLINLNDECWAKYFAPLLAADKQTITILPILLNSKSEGQIMLGSDDPDEPPLINPNYLHHSDDVERLVDGIQIIKQLLRTAAFRSVAAKLNPTVLPGCDMHAFDTMPYWRCYVRHLTLSVFHPFGTCRMRKHTDHGGGVVNSAFRVLGLDALYVCDASVLPVSISGNPNAAIGMLAEKFVASLRFD